MRYPIYSLKGYIYIYGHIYREREREGPDSLIPY